MVAKRLEESERGKCRVDWPRGRRGTVLYRGGCRADTAAFPRPRP
jgi:hypothetical protein